MDRFPGIDALPRGIRVAATVGVFDGVHRGHEAVLRSVVRLATDTGSASLVVTFTPHPETVLRGSTPLLLCDPVERTARFAQLGVDHLVVQSFDSAFAAQSAAVFLSRLTAGRDLAGLVMSVESAFGHDREGNLERVRAIAATSGFPVVEVPSLRLGGERVSSTRVRADLEAGRLADAARSLGRRPAVIGTVVHGDRRGRELGFPTANLAFDDPVCLPPNGVYAVHVSWGGADPLAPRYQADGVASLGVRPTFGGGARLLEAHLFDFDGDLYDQRLRVGFVRRQRGEHRFESVDALVAQMRLDVTRARAILARLPADRTPVRLAENK
ncbi:MAG: riboflavin biosynthesis protein RibF [Candidatus Limnocylindrales bacterium]